MFTGIYLFKSFEFKFILTRSACSYDGVAMGSLLGLILADTFLCHFKEQWMPDCPINYKHISYRRYVKIHFNYFHLNSCDQTFKLHQIKLYQIIESLHLMVF